ncbi:DUF3662 and FHA domain-containing protein [uncultured Corynebacterium sp.]|uniref:DUF3662 and FHA domain-containing protein n=1 Tax=uncultured Corynebacterium sp. TaxID=159447 RepID=UPI0025FC0D18|nr:DUF3662 and FHA domain-containing protein [uncultured Corynebacterium sp.]
MDLFGRFRKLDSSLQRGLDNGLARVFGGEVVPTEIDELLKQQAEDAVMTDNYGKQLAPCYYTVLVSRDDHQSLIEDRPNLEADLADRLTRFIRNNGWTTPSPIHVEIEAHRNLHSGQLRARSLFGEPDRRSSQSDAPESPDHAAPEGHDGSTPAATAHDQQGGSPDGSYPDSYPGQQLNSPAQWPQRDNNGQREVAAREYDAPSDHVYEDTAFSESTYRAPEENVQEDSYATDDAATFDSAAGSDSVADNTSSAGEDNRGLADIVRSGGSASATSAASAAGAAGGANSADNPSVPSAHGDEWDSREASENWDGDQRGVGEENDPSTGQQEAQQPSYPGTEIIAQSMPDTPVKGGEGYGEQDSDVRVILHLRDGSDRKYQLQDGSNLIGRGNGVDLRIPDTGVSRQHADIVWDGYDAVLTDLNSTNGTTVNDTPVENWLLADGDLIVVGHSEIMVHFEQK